MHNMISFYKALAKKICQGTEYIRKAMRTRWPNRLVWQSATVKDLKLNLHTKHLARREYDQEEPGKTKYWEDAGVGVSVYWGGGTGAVNNMFPPRTSHYLPRFQFLSLHQRTKFILEILVKTWTNHNVKAVLMGAVRWEVRAEECRVWMPKSVWHKHSSILTSHLTGKLWKRAAVKAEVIFNLKVWAMCWCSMPSTEAGNTFYSASKSVFGAFWNPFLSAAF